MVADRGSPGGSGEPGLPQPRRLARLQLRPRRGVRRGRLSRAPLAARRCAPAGRCSKRPNYKLHAAAVSFSSSLSLPAPFHRRAPLQPPRLGLKRGKFPQNATCGASVSGSGPEPPGSLPRPGPAAGTCGARGAPSRPAAPVVIAIKAGNMWRHMAGSRCWGGSLVLALHLFISCV